MSRRYVPTDIAITDTAYWVETYRFNAQVEQYRQEVLGFQGQINALRDDLESDYVPFPNPAYHPKYGTLGQVLSTLADGTTLWQDPVVPSDEQAEAIITAWLDDHPEATTTVQDGAVTDAKLAANVFKRRTTADYTADFNAMVDCGYYGLVGGTTYANAPTSYTVSGGGVLITFKYYPTTDYISQMLIEYGASPSLKPKMFIRSGNHLLNFTSWTEITDTPTALNAARNAIDFKRRTTTDYGTDFNTMLDSGYYGLSSGTTYTNAPSEYPASGGVLITYKYYAATDWFTQILIESKTNAAVNMYFRSGHPTLGISPWSKVETEIDFMRRTTANYGNDLDAMTDSGYYGLDGGTTYSNLPDDFVSSGGGVLVTFKYYRPSKYLSQILLNYSNNQTCRAVYFRSGNPDVANSMQPWSKLPFANKPIIENNKIALFGDSIMSGTIKTPSSVETHCVGKYIQNGLRVPVVDGSEGSIGYITHLWLNHNILELVKAVDLTGCKTFVCSAGDNDGTYPIGTYTDTNADYPDYADAASGATIMGNVYKMVDYLHTTYPDMCVIIASKTNTRNEGTFPLYRRDPTTRTGQLNAELKKFADYYGCGWLDISDCGMDGWLLGEVLEYDNVHFKDIGYRRVAEYMVGELIKYTGTGDYIAENPVRVTWPS